MHPKAVTNLKIDIYSPLVKYSAMYLRCIKKPAKHLREAFLENNLSSYLFSQKATPLMLDRVLITPIKPIMSKLRCWFIC